MIKYVCGLALGFAAALAPAAPASAQPALSDKEVYDIGRCVVRSDRSVGVGLLQSLPLSGPNLTIPGTLSAAGQCAKAGGSVSPVALRGAIARALFLKDFDRFMVEPKVANHLLAELKLPIDEKAANGADPQTVALYKFGDCVVRNEVMKIESLMRTPVGSGTEEKIFEYLAPMMAACQAKGTTIRVSPSTLRSLLAQSAYNVSWRYWKDQLFTAAR
jgi:hypothetical protein